MDDRRKDLKKVLGYRPDEPEVEVEAEYRVEPRREREVEEERPRPRYTREEPEYEDEPDYDNMYETEHQLDWKDLLNPFKRRNWYFSLGRFGWGFWVLIGGTAAYFLTQFVIRPWMN
jgi:hypothetical protein